MAGTASTRALEKAYLSIMEPFPPGSEDGSGGGGGGELGELTFTFNPSEYTVATSAQWRRSSQRGAESASVPEFAGSDPRTLSLEVFLDATDSPEEDVAGDVELLVSCTQPTERSREEGKPSPPFVIFGWGSTTSFTAYVRSVNARFTLFRPDGTPTRAVCQLTLEEVPSPTPRQNPTSGGEAARRVHTVVAGETLADVAYRAYRDPSLWRGLATVNDIDDPMRVRAGTQLLLPPSTEVAAWDAGEPR